MRLPRPFVLLGLLALLTLVPLAVLADHHESDQSGESAPLADRLAKGDRPEADKARDAGRKPAEVIAFLGIEPGMTVMDLIAAGGYYTDVLAEAVGSEGKVYAQNPPFVLEYREGANEKELTERLADDRLPQVVRLDEDLADVEVEPGSLDAALTALNFHDIIHSENGAKSAQGFLTRVHELLKPGGVLGLIDHVGNPGADNAKLHRIQQERVVAAAKEAGFEVEATSDILRNPDDDRLRQVFDPAIRGKTDRFLLKLRKPR